MNYFERLGVLALTTNCNEYELSRFAEVEENWKNGIGKPSDPLSTWQSMIQVAVDIEKSQLAGVNKVTTEKTTQNPKKVEAKTEQAKTVSQAPVKEKKPFKARADILCKFARTEQGCLRQKQGTCSFKHE